MRVNRSKSVTIFLVQTLPRTLKCEYSKISDQQPFDAQSITMSIALIFTARKYKLLFLA
ncbi:hypothetical protein IE4771_PB00300 (plasmid) [Rhizobium etli bv. mimosae str. IE4771]|uniref:Uncharacterized protein n=1 Tax=Rhizobium etli bv. mimosae str. IE4771 TaxID=1432050 RepID=A0A060I4L1_RHIET|nr:hypothetical protein IE4771_PB00300 [Rhizobium sp. IE4771]